ncbi:ketopantoate reductase family protein [Novosphingobium taihuense]|uniref:2-dehydropantoate 2-reductase n=1 Tax=Novosphingobium taihuense TaxID=260085 RepID=A0A7W7AAW2_9SPHN|nr:2-dehydropantoate 2-reductase [Novosphingobium taihuense]MBB4612852.1 2-dehydropantoate 2-reductase [Novosphingobium taihuense]TWH81959.1 2-dehydropantoate 2-reductase [Novosphingobium taihuense]
MRVFVIGTGAMGTLFGARLLAAGHDVTFIDADSARVDAINHGGVSENGVAIPARAVLPGSASGVADLVIVFTKSMFTKVAVQQNLNLIGDTTSVLTLQNGLGNGECIAELVGPEKVLCGITNWPADLLGHGRIHVGGEGSVKLWSLDGSERPAIATVTSALNNAGLAATADVDVQRHVWEKVIFNAALNGVAALTRLTVGQIGAHGPSCDMAIGIVTEGIKIAKAVGIQADGKAVHANVEFAMLHHCDHKPSMLQDVEAGRPMEVDSIQGGLLAAARSSGVDAPLLNACASLLRGLNHASALRAGR